MVTLSSMPRRALARSVLFWSLAQATSLLACNAAEDAASDEAAGLDAGGGGAGLGGAASGGQGGLPAAGGAGGGAGGAGGQNSSGPTWSDSVAAVVGQRCVSCHHQGGAAPFALETYEAAAPMAGAIADAVAAGRMPPWLPNPDCRHFEAERLMPAAEREVLAAWAAAGAPAGDATTLALDPAEVVDPGPPSVIASPLEAYAPDPARPDDYRCFPLDAAFPAETYVVGTHVLPDVVPIVHHVLVYVVPEERLADMQALDDRDPGPGYTCYGGTDLGNVGPMAAWVPGYQPQRFPEGVAAVIPAGSRLIMQVHYNTLSAESEPDLTGIHLWTSESPPTLALRSRPLANLGIEIPAGEAESTHTMEINQNGREPWTIVGVGPHMHLLGRSIRVDAITAQGETCLVDIPRWNFNWQQNYRFLPEEPVVLQPAEKLRLTCVFDNSPENQPVINGEQLPPRDVTWGEGTQDEMCLAFINVVEPFTAGAGLCTSLSACQAECAEPESFGCLLDCAQQDQTCATCLIQSIVGEGGCARTSCGATLVPAGDCLRTCVPQAITQGTPMTACLESTCPAEYTAFADCMDGALAEGACDPGLNECDVSR